MKRRVSEGRETQGREAVPRVNIEPIFPLCFLCALCASVVKILQCQQLIGRRNGETQNGIYARTSVSPYRT
jgi:hypothetical protein